MTKKNRMRMKGRGGDGDETREDISGIRPLVRMISS